MGVGWPQEPPGRRGGDNFQIWSSTQALSTPGGFLGMYPLPWQGQGHPSKQCRLRVSWLSLFRGIVTPMIPNWIKQGCRLPHCVKKLIFHFTFNVILVEMFV